MPRRTRLVAAVLAIAALLLAPLAVAWHACPMSDTQMQAASHDGDAPVLAELCAHHCEDGKLAVETVKPAPTFTAALLPALHVAPAVPREIARSAWRKDGFLADPSPPFARSTVLRI